MRIAWFAFAFLSLAGAPSAWAVSQSQLDQESRYYKDSSDLFNKTCVDASGNILNQSVSATSPQGQTFLYDCAVERNTLIELSKKIVAEQIALDRGKTATCDEVSGLPDTNSALIGQVSKVLDKTPACKNTQTAAQCGKDIGCNLLRSAQTAAGGLGLKFIPGLAELMDKGIPEQLRSCIGTSKPDCMSSLILGVFRDLWSNLEGIYDGVKWVGGKLYEKTKNATIHAGSWLGLDSAKQAEDELEKKMLASANQGESWITKFKQHPAEFLKDTAAGIWQAMTSAMVNQFACEKYNGFTCVKPAASWTCATCDQKINAVCGAGGYIAGEVVVAYLTAGTVAVAKNSLIAVKDAALATKIGLKFAEALPDLDKLGQLADKAGTSARAFAKGVGTLASEIAEHPVIKDIADIGKALAAKAAPVTSAATKVVKVVGAPARAYIDLLERAGKLGFETGEKLSSSWTVSAKIRRVQVLEALASATDAQAAASSGSAGAALTQEAQGYRDTVAKLRKEIQKQGGATALAKVDGNDGGTLSEPSAGKLASGGIDPAVRAKGEAILGRPLSDEQAKALTEAHQIGGDKTVGTYDPKEIAAKDRTLARKDADGVPIFNSAERQDLIRKSGAGGEAVPNSLPIDTAQQQFVGDLKPFSEVSVPSKDGFSPASVIRIEGDRAIVQPVGSGGTLIPTQSSVPLDAVRPRVPEGDILLSDGNTGKLVDVRGDKALVTYQDGNGITYSRQVKTSELKAAPAKPFEHPALSHADVPETPKAEYVRPPDPPIVRPITQDQRQFVSNLKRLQEIPVVKDGKVERMLLQSVDGDYALVSNMSEDGMILPGRRVPISDIVSAHSDTVLIPRHGGKPPSLGGILSVDGKNATVIFRDPETGAFMHKVVPIDQLKVATKDAQLARAVEQKFPSTSSLREETFRKDPLEGVDAQKLQKVLKPDQSLTASDLVTASRSRTVEEYNKELADLGPKFVDAQKVVQAQRDAILEEQASLNSLKKAIQQDSKIVGKESEIASYRSELEARQAALTNAQARYGDNLERAHQLSAKGGETNVLRDVRVLADEDAVEIKQVFKNGREANDLLPNALGPHDEEVVAVRVKLKKEVELCRGFTGSLESSAVGSFWGGCPGKNYFDPSLESGLQATPYQNHYTHFERQQFKAGDEFIISSVGPQTSTAGKTEYGLSNIGGTLQYQRLTKVKGVEGYVNTELTRERLIRDVRSHKAIFQRCGTFSAISVRSPARPT